MIQFDDGGRHEEHYKELISKHSVEAVDSGFKFGVASVIASLYNWSDELKKEEITVLTSRDIKSSFVDWISYDMEINLLFNHLLESEN
jgi:pantothenate kinase type III